MSGLVVAPKPHNSKEIRVCGDYRRVNQAIKRERHPIPMVDELFESTSGAVMFSKVDLKAGYHQIPLMQRHARLQLSRHTRVCFATSVYLLVSLQQVKCFKMPLKMH